MLSYQAEPRVSVIVPSYNHARFLPERFASILAQTFQDFELIVLDDASTDDSVAVIESLLANIPHKLIINHTNSGSPCCQWIRGIREARCHYIWIAESDDSCYPDFLQIMVASLAGSCGLSYCRSAAINTDSKRIDAEPFWPEQHHPGRWQTSFRIPASEFCQDLMVGANCIPNASAVVFDREASQACLSLEPLLASKLYTGDWIFWLHLLRELQHRPVAYVASDISSFRHHSVSTRTATNPKAVERRRLREYCETVRWIQSQHFRASRLPWLHHCLRRDWEWILVEYLWRLQPSKLQRYTARGLCGPLATSLPLRLLLTPHLRKLFQSVGLSGS